MSDLQKQLRDGVPMDDTAEHRTLLCLAADALDAQAQEIARLTAELADERQSREINRAVATAALDERDALRARLVERDANAERYLWLRTRINWRDVEERGINTVTRYRAWTHCDYRVNPPTSEHIDDYIDAARGGA